MNHPYFPQGDQDLREMMEIVGVSSLEDLFRTIPESIRLKSLLNVPRALPEQRLVAHRDDLSQRNCLGEASKRFLGGGAYSHYIPSIIDTVLLRAEFYTSYTPYQPEISQGGLQALFEFQTDRKSVV